MSDAFFEQLPNMNSVEILNLAKNRFLPPKIQVWLAKNAPLRARYYLAKTEGICQDSITVLKSGKSYLIRGLLVQSGNIKDPQEIREIYKEIRSKTHDNEWRLSSLFVETSSGYSGLRGGVVKDTPSDVIEDIFDHSFQRFMKNKYAGYFLHRVIRHPNVTAKIAIQLSQQNINPTLQKLGFEVLAKLNSKK